MGTEMGRVNAIDLNHKFADIAAELRRRGNQELRAKLVNGSTVLYSKKVKPFDRLIGNLFHDRAQKRGAAQQLIFDCFRGLDDSKRDAILQPAYFRKPTADVFEKVFSNAATFKFSSQNRVLPHRFEDFLSLPDSAFEYFLPAIKDAAKGRGVTSDLEFVLNLRMIGRLNLDAAQQLAAKVAIRMINENYNVKGESLKAFAKSFGLTRAAAQRLTLQDWKALMRQAPHSPEQLASLFADAAKEVGRDLHNNIYSGKFNSAR